jgi:hypothetical protein
MTRGMSKVPVGKIRLICLADLALPPGVTVETTRVIWLGPITMIEGSAREILKRKGRKKEVRQCPASV